MIEDVKNKEQIAIVVVGYNRLKSITRLLNSLLEAHYPNDNIPLVICIDCSGDQTLYKYVNDFYWQFGEKYVFIQQERLGLKNHILTCGDISRFFKAIILLEDDLHVGPEFYNYVCATVDKYKEDDRIAGISLFNDDFNRHVALPFTPLENDSDVYAVQTVVTWGECWTDTMWHGFRTWLKDALIDFNTIDMPENIKLWERAWSKYYFAYMLANDKYFILPYTAVSTNFSDAGEHGDTKNTLVQVDLLIYPKQYRLLDFEDLIKYDVYNNNVSLYKSLHLKKEDLCVDMYGHNSNRNNRKYWLSIQDLPYKRVKQFALNLRPQELNIIRNIEGEDVFLYDTTKSGPLIGKRNINIMRYHLRSFIMRDLTKFIVIYWLRRIRSKISFLSN